MSPDEQAATDRASKPVWMFACCARPELELMAVREDGTRSFECRGCGVKHASGGGK